MPRTKLAATRSNLILAKQQLALARQGYKLLDRKREVLMLEIMRVIGQAEDIQGQTNEQFKQAYAILQQARAAMGTERVMRFALSRVSDVDTHVTPRSVMGVPVPEVTIYAPQSRLPYGFGDTSVVLDRAQHEWAEVVDLLGPLANYVTTVWRLTLELKRTQRRVNALRSVFIPAYEETVRYIEATLEEKDREDLFRLKRVKSKTATIAAPSSS
ncbi:MAG: V-type ATP synthase subunit D [Chloroflexi bacterium]|nr:V-type ATP synthase subunit D [Chloroflexota bacterium]